MKLTPERRKHLYQVLAALLPLLAAYGLISESEAALWVALAAALLASSPAFILAARHVPDATDYVGRHRSGE